MIVHIMESSNFAGLASYLRYEQITGQNMARKHVLYISTFLELFFEIPSELKIIDLQILRRKVVFRF